MAEDDEDSKPKHLFLASNQDQKSIDKNERMEALEWKLRTLAANVLRIVRGAGKPHELGIECADVVNAIEEYREVAGAWPRPEDVSDAISLRHREIRTGSDDAFDFEHGLNEIMFGSLQRAASLLVRQHTQEAAGRSQLFSGFDVIESIRQKNRLKHQQAAKAQTRKPAKSPKAKKRAKTVPL